MSESWVAIATGPKRGLHHYQWDALPVPCRVVRSHRFRRGAYIGYTHTLREDLPDGTAMLASRSLRCIYEISAGWHTRVTAIHDSGHLSWSRQSLCEASELQLTSVFRAPDLTTADVRYAVYALSTDSLVGGSEWCRKTIVKSLDTFSLIYESQELGIRREFLLRPLGSTTASFVEIDEDQSATPQIRVCADDSQTLTQTLRWLVFELMGVLVPERFLGFSMQVRQPYACGRANRLNQAAAR